MTKLGQDGEISVAHRFRIRIFRRLSFILRPLWRGTGGQQPVFIPQLHMAVGGAGQAEAQTCKFKLRRGDPPAQHRRSAEHQINIGDRGDAIVVFPDIEIINGNHQIFVATVPFQFQIAKIDIQLGILAVDELNHIGFQKG